MFSLLSGVKAELLLNIIIIISKMVHLVIRLANQRVNSSCGMT